ncbi:HAMP domain-containing sensor histidine kinase [Anaerocolumna sp. MB42-C2]|uniref:HAMP domain-containing sensor histidine kinase n=1 Tax=Anaerocolumna sp. MB42-C2 TaxID=3070997 RepID=UPI0027E19733|nr:HAMP domain-containing sensor histidine kinase [Anaerocolumna sp. MB42-C2]WMJ87745.1 HAMP domain-containing sensor histidine kinase [Anaerocolumna sp. MB42-C2]
MRVHSLFALFLIGILPILFFAWEMLNTYDTTAFEQRKNDLQSQGSSMANLLLTSGYFSDPTIEEVNTELLRTANIYDGRILVVDNKLNILKDTYGIEDGNIIISEDVIKCLGGVNSIRQDKENNFVEMTVPITRTTTTTKEVMGVILMNFSTKNINTISAILSQKANVLFLTTAILIFVYAFFYSGVFTKPFINLKKAIGHLTEGYMDEEVKVDGFYEVKQISNSLNQMLLRIKNLERSRQEFVSNVSHELKTPITSIKVLADSLIMQENVPPELYREFLVDITEEIERENKIINDLLSLVKLDKTASEMNITSIKINDLLELVLKRLRPIAKKNNIELIYESFRPVIAEVDEVKLSLALSNLIENAIKYNVEDGWVRVSLNADHKYFYVKVADSGIGIPEDAQDFIFDRFYRVDKARSRGTGGTGLGLSITKNAIHMHKGAIKVYSKENEGTTFTVRVPINYIA